MRMMITLKHWVLFLLLVGPTLVASIVSRPNELSQWEISASIIGSIVYFGWLWSINRRVSNGIRSGKDVFFVICFAIVFIYFLSYNLFLLFGRIGEEDDLEIYNLLVLSLTVFCLAVISKRLKSHEVNRPATLGEYFWYVVLLLIFPIGVWVLQPRINRL